MRKLIAAMVATLAVAAVTAATAGAQTVSKFSVETVNTHPLHGGETNVAAARLSEVGETEFVGRLLAKFNSNNHVHAVASFNGRGRIRFAGNFGNNNKLHITGGSGVWNGASGKVKVHTIGGGEVVLSFTVVQ